MECWIDDIKRIALIFPYDRNVITLIKQIEGRNWSVSQKCWHIPYRENYLAFLNEQFLGKLEFIESTSSQLIEKKPDFPTGYLKTLKLLGYSEPTIKTYQGHFQRFLNYFPKTKLEDITPDEIREYIIYLVETKKYSISSQNNSINAIRFYYSKVQYQEIEEFYLPRPHKAKTIPHILNEQEVSLILKNVCDLRDKCMIFLIYSAGLTPSEILYLKPEQIDSKNMKIFISSATGDKDRYVVLASKILNLLREYFLKYKPKEWLFEAFPGKQYSKRNLQKAFQTAVQKSGIAKPATLTILKNSFAVHPVG